MGDSRPSAESELDSFRNAWKAEVTARTRQPQSITNRPKQTRKNTKATWVEPSTSQHVQDHIEDLEPTTYHDLPDKEEQLKLSAGQDHDRNHPQSKPSSALEHYERAVERESQGQLGESIKLYRQAFKLDDEVHEQYKRKYFPPQSEAQKQNAATTAAAVSAPTKADSVPATLQEIVRSFATAHIEPPPPPTDASPALRSRLGELPDEIVSQILSHAAVSDVASMSRFSVVCRYMAYLAMTEESIWRAVALQSRFGFADMLYRFACDVEGHPLKVIDAGFNLDDLEIELDEAKMFAHTQTAGYIASSYSLATQLVTNLYAGSWRQMYRSRPRIRFNGCYISTVNYTRAGGNHMNSLSWGTPVHVVTYYRYLRFFRDGTAISLLTTSEPHDVVHHLVKDNLHHHHGTALPSSVMKDALRGRWRLTGPLSACLDSAGQPETEGELIVETQGGNTGKYTFELRLALSNAGKGARNNKLAWKSFHSRNRLTDDSAPFTLKHDKGFYWSRVRSFN